MIHDVMIALMTVGAPSFPDEHYAMIPFPLGDQMTVENAVTVIYAQLEEPFGYLRMMAPEACIRGFVICDHLGTRLLCEATLASNGVDIIHDA
jgi:hypothetical protein